MNLSDQARACEEPKVFLRNVRSFVNRGNADARVGKHE